MELVKALIESNERQPERFAVALAEALKGLQIGVSPTAPTPVMTTIQLGNSGNSQNSQGKKASPKLEYAVQWLLQYPEDVLVSGRELEQRVTMNGETISYKWWNEAKKMAAKGNGEGA